MDESLRMKVDRPSVASAAGVPAEVQQTDSPTDVLAAFEDELLDWDFRIDPPPGKTEIIKVRFIQGGPEPFECRPDPRD